MKIIVAKNFKNKLIGLMGKKNIDYSLLIKNCKSIHTFFMKESIDILFVRYLSTLKFIVIDYDVLIIIYDV